MSAWVVYGVGVVGTGASVWVVGMMNGQVLQWGLLQGWESVGVGKFMRLKTGINNESSLLYC